MSQITCRFCGQPQESASSTCPRNIDREDPVHEWVNEAGEQIETQESENKA